MQRIKLSGEQLNEVIRLRKGGSKWLQIQKQTKISRHIAQREYENWERNQSQSSLKEARIEVAAEAFRDHINYLVRVAETLKDRMRTPTVSDRDNVDQFLDKAWGIGIISHSLSSDLSLESSDWRMAAPGRMATLEDTVSETAGVTNTKRNLHQNHMLFQSLITHTRDRVQWKDLDEWKKSWNVSVGDIKKIREETLKMVDTFLAREESTYPGVTKNILKHTPHRHPLEQIADAILKELLRRLENNESDLYKEVTKTRQQRDATLLIFSSSYGMILKFNDVKSAAAANRVCNGVTKELAKKYEKDLIASLKNSIGLMRKVKEEFEEVLDPLVLRPMILRTSCDLCPAPL